MANGFRIKRGTAAQITAAGATNSLNVGEPYLITDQNRLAVGTAVNTYEPHAKLSEVLAKQDALVSGTNIKTVNGQSLLGSGDIVVSSATRKTASIPFTDGQSIQTVTVTDAAVTGLVTPFGLNVYDPTPEENAMGLSYSVVLRSVNTGSFDVEITAFDPEGDSLTGLPLPDVTLNYLV